MHSHSLLGAEIWNIPKLLANIKQLPREKIDLAYQSACDS